jgi:hypothetical protein
LSGAYDVMQVCLNGHQITSSANEFPQFRSPHCTSCGAATITACTSCNTSIKGHLIDSMSIYDPDVPSYCGGCGAAFPWRLKAIKNAEDTIRELGLPLSDIDGALDALPDVMAETPGTSSAALRMKRFLSSAGKPTYEIALGVITDLLSETAKKTLGLK